MMNIEPTFFKDVYIITFEPIEDKRGSFTRFFCRNELLRANLAGDFVQCNISYNHCKGTLRGLHYQNPPYAEIKIVTCRRGAIYDVIVDIRPDSATYGKWMHIEMTESNYKALYIPAGFAHGFQSLCDNTEVFYFMGNYYCQKAARGIHWNDAKLNISWPCSQKIISERDSSFPGFPL